MTGHSAWALSVLNYGDILYKHAASFLSGSLIQLILHLSVFITGPKSLAHHRISRKLVRLDVSQTQAKTAKLHSY